MGKKAFRSKLLELCKTGTKKSSPDMFNFDLILAGHGMISDAGRATTCRRKFTAPSLRTKCTKMKDLPKTWVLRGKQFEDFRRKKKNRNIILDLSKTTQWNTRTLIASIEEGPRKK